MRADMRVKRAMSTPESKLAAAVIHKAVQDATRQTSKSDVEHMHGQAQGPIAAQWILEPSRSDAVCSLDWWASVAGVSAQAIRERVMSCERRDAKRTMGI